MGLMEFLYRCSGLTTQLTTQYQPLYRLLLQPLCRLVLRSLSMQTWVMRLFSVLFFSKGGKFGETLRTLALVNNLSSDT